MLVVFIAIAVAIPVGILFHKMMDKIAEYNRDIGWNGAIITLHEMDRDNPAASTLEHLLSMPLEYHDPLKSQPQP